MLLSPSASAESPTWQLMKNRREEVKQAISRLYDEGHVQT
ncbi:hypothetical protein GN958_ATG15110 [Phytophthora infestans]|uniref:Uncharacterized protein n=1 Tax=Phytophthora infestans TaxID=4787 RepID=A0A8S9U8B8_PHYIN|nr:hypothetical protein GN958_ATG15110 [Phytophthora infestans]